MTDWTTDAADTIERVVVTVREKTVTPATALSRGIVFGLLTAFFAGGAAVLAAIGIFRLLNIALPTWAAWAVLGGIFVLSGAFCWTRRSTHERT